MEIIKEKNLFDCNDLIKNKKTPPNQEGHNIYRVLHMVPKSGQLKLSVFVI